VGQNVALHLPFLSAQLSGRASHTQIHTGDAGQLRDTCAGVPRLEFGAVHGRWCALFHTYIMFSQSSLPPTTPFFAPRALAEPEKIKLSNGVLRSGNCAVTAEFCPEGAYWPPLPKEGVTQWGDDLDTLAILFYYLHVYKDSDCFCKSNIYLTCETLPFPYSI